MCDGKTNRFTAHGAMEHRISIVKLTASITKEALVQLVLHGRHGYGQQHIHSAQQRAQTSGSQLYKEKKVLRHVTFDSNQQSIQWPTQAWKSWLHERYIDMKIFVTVFAIYVTKVSNTKEVFHEYSNSTTQSDYWSKQDKQKQLSSVSDSVTNPTQNMQRSDSRSLRDN